MDFLRVPTQILRKLSVFYLFAVLLAGSLGLYYWGIIPRNKEEVNSRAHRVLNQITRNLLRKDENLNAVFSFPVLKISDTVFVNNLLNHKENFGSLNGLEYKSAILTNPDKPDLKKNDTLSFFGITSEGNNYWEKYKRLPKNVYPKDSSYLFVKIPIRNMLSGLLGTRTDIFDSYLILENDTSTKIGETGSRPFPLLFAEDPITYSPLVYADTVRSLFKNSDGSATGPITISGTNYMVFFRPFRLHNQRLILAGLVAAESYSKKVHQTPIDFIPVCLILIILILVALPISKVFLLSPKERIGRIDVLGIAFSYYAGTIILCLILFYSSHQFITDLTFTNRIRDVGTKIKSSVETTFTESNDRLRKLDAMTPPEGGQYMVASQINAGNTSDSFAKLAGRHTRRLFWFDSSGNTIAKWNAFKFIAPNSSVAGLDFYDTLENRGPAPDPNNSYYFVTVGKSNINDEFQVYLTRPSEKVFRKSAAEKDTILEKSIGISEAMDLDISSFPVIPTGFGFYITDQNGKVLICNEPDRNLSENILDESGDNIILKNTLKTREKTGSFTIDLYGNSCRAMVWPIQGQYLNLIVYYDQHKLSAHFMRMLLFGILSLFFMLLAISLSVLFSVPLQSGVRQLRYLISPVEWMQPTPINAQSYRFTFGYFCYQLLIFLLMYVMLILGGQSLEPLFSCSVLFPFYAVWAFFYSRLPAKQHEWARGIFTRCPIPLAFLLGSNIIIGFLYGNPGFEYWAIILGVQGILIFLLYRFAVDKKNKLFFPIPPFIKKHAEHYNASLMLSMAVCCIIPVTGIMSYAYQAEKIQYKKEKLFSYTAQMQGWQRFVHNSQADELKDNFKNDLGGCAYKHLAFMSDGDGLNVMGEPKCLTQPPDENKSLEPDSGNRLPILEEKSRTLADNFYSSVVNRFSGVSNSLAGFRAIGNSSLDDSWRFWQEKDSILKPPRLELMYNTVETGIGINRIYASSNVQNILVDFFKLPWTFIVVMIILFMLSVLFIRWIIIATTARLFPVRFIPAEITVDQQWLSNIFDGTDPAKEAKIDWSSHFDPEFAMAKSNARYIKKVEFIDKGEKEFQTIYEKLWLALSEEERYILYDFAIDSFSSYRNLPVLMSLVEKGILVKKDGVWEVFSLSFKEYILDKKDSNEIKSLEKNYRVAGNWAVLRVSILSLVAAAGILIVTTQSDISHQVLAAITSITALLPLITRFLTKPADDSNDKKKKTTEE